MTKTDVEPIEEDLDMDEMMVSLPILTVTPHTDVVSADTLITYPLSGENWDFAPPTSDIQLRIQENLELYVGKKNGKWGNLSVYAIQEAVGRYSGTLDYDLTTRIQEFASEHGGLDLNTVSPGILDTEAWLAFALALEA